MTSALPYIHGLPHLGNIVGSILPADLYHRYLDLRGHENIYICGSDEHGTPLELSAIEAGEEPKEHADAQHEAVKEVLEDFGMGFSLYGRTHTAYNEQQTRAMFIQLYRNGYIAEKEQQLPYCLECERFLPDRYLEGACPECGGLARGDQCDDCGTLLEPEEVEEPHCTICGQERIEFRTTKNLFLQLGKFEDQLKEWLKTREPLPGNKRKEVLNLIDEGLEDRCITRDIEWGFPVPYEELDLDSDVYGDKVLYVWFDAPIGYIGITRQYFTQDGEEEQWREYWQNTEARTVYSIGKDNTIFHSIIFPSMLMGSSEEEPYNLPDHEFIHEYLLSEDVQFSKSRGHGLSSRDALDLLPPDYWRFYLSTVIPETHDSTFTWKDLETKVNSELNDTVGNFVNRVLTLTEQWFDGEVPAPQEPERYADIRERLEELVEAYDDAFEGEKSPKKAVKLALDIARLGDEFLSREEPWKHEEGRADVLFLCLGICEALTLLLSPFIPSSAGKLWRMLGHEQPLISGEDRLAGFLDGHWLQPGQELGERSILFEKIDGGELAEQLYTGEDSDMDDTMDDEDTVSFEQFQQLNLRTGTILDVDEHPNADKLYRIQIDVGGETKQSCAGLKPYFEPDELEGQQVIVVNNLEPTELRGELSECMILAVDTGEDVIPLVPAEDVADGLPIK